jgi:hypothetical protein
MVLEGGVRLEGRVGLTMRVVLEVGVGVGWGGQAVRPRTPTSYRRASRSAGSE